MLVYRLAPEGASLNYSFKRLNQLRRLARMKSVVLRSAEAAHLRPGTHPRPVLVTLTYRPEATWHPRQIAEYIDRVQKHLRAPAPYQWVMELTQKGRPHYHVLWWLPRGTTLPMADKAGHWRHGSTETARARKGPAYIAKYTSKGMAGAELYALPAHARLFGAAGTPDASHKARLPAWLREHCTDAGERIKRLARIGWCSTHTGELWPSPFSLRVVRTDTAYHIEVHKQETSTC